MLARDCRDLIAQYRRDLEAQLQRRDVRRGIERVRDAYPVLAKYPSTEALAALMRQRGPAFYEDKDAVLRTILAEIRRELDSKQKPLLFALLNVVFWASLCDIFWRKVRSCPDPDDLLSRVCAGFYEVAVTYPHHRPGSFGGNLYWDTWKKITAWQQQEARHREPCRPLGPADDKLADPREAEVHPKDMAVYQKVKPLGPADEAHIILGDPRIAEVYPEDMESYLLGFVYQKVINETQYDMLLEAKVYKRMTQKQWAEAHEVDYATARSWRHRAELAIRAFEQSRRERP